MDHIQDVYKKKPDMINKIWDHLTKVNLKVDGKPFQVVYNEDEDELEYHGRSGNETKVGPLIDDMYRLFSKPINDAIRHIENRVEVFKRYKFLTFEVIDEILLLTAIITKEGKFVDDPDEIDEIAKELDTDVMPCLWKGKLSDEQRDILMTAISTDIIPTKDDFVKWVKDLFGTYKKFPKTLISRSTEFIEGIVFFYDVDGKVVEYKLVDPSFRQMVKDNHANMKQDGIENAEKYTEIYTSFLNWAEENAKGLDKNRMRSIEFNFIKMMKDPKIYNKLMKEGAGLTTITTDAYFLQPDRISDELKKVIKKHGKVYQLLYEKFVRLFYKAKKRGFVLSKEFQARVNKAVDKFADYSLNEDEIEINGELILEEDSMKYGPYNFIIDRETQFKDVSDDDIIKYATKTKDHNRPENYVNLITDLCGNNSEEFKDFVEKITNDWITNHEGQKRFIPFRFNKNPKTVKLARAYSEYSGIEKSKTIKGTHIIIGNGLGGGQGGNEFETNLAVGIFRYLLNGCEIEGLTISDVDVKKCLTNIHNDSAENNNQYNELHRILKDECLPKINEIVEKNKSELITLSDDDLAKRLYSSHKELTGLKQTGGANTKRGLSNIFDIENNDFNSPSKIEKETAEDNVDKKLESSGEIISDITIPSKEKDIYLSVKEDAAQLSGVVISPSIRINKDGKKNTYRWMDSFFDTDLPEHKDNATAFFKIFGIDANDLKSLYQNEVSEQNKGGKIKLNINEKELDGNIIGKTISRLIGGNYWYVSPSKCFFVSANKKGFIWELDKTDENYAYLSGTGRTIVIKGKIGEIKCEIILRTANIKDKYPTRLFPKIKGDDLLKLMQK